MEKEGQKGDFWPLFCKFKKNGGLQQESGKMGFERES